MIEPSIRKRIVDFLMERLSGDEECPQPPELGGVNLSKNRSVPIGADEMPLYSVYFINDSPTAIGDPRRATLVQRKLLVEVRIIVRGNDDVADPHCVWVTDRIVSADRCIDADGNQLALSVIEDETPFESLEGAQQEVGVTKIRFIVEYKTSRTDITKTS